MPDREVTAMLDCEDGDKDRNSNCRHCQAGGESESHHRDHHHQRYWDIHLDQDLLETIASIYPEWFKDCNMNDSMCLLSNIKQENGEHRTIDKNKESLKVKLMLRRPLNQLVDQGILPSLKSPPAFHEQRQKLERAKMGDILKHKLQKRPDRQELIQQHVLEDSSVDSSLQDKQKQLKKARLSDTLNGLISQRPGPLDMVKGNILNSDELLAQAVRESALPFKSPCGTPSPKVRSTPIDDDSGSDVAFSPSPPYDFSEHSQSSLPSVEASEPSSLPNQGSPCSAAFSMSPPSSVSSPLSSVFPSILSPNDNIADFLVHHHHLQHCANNKEAVATPNKNRKKTKPKTQQPKARTIKFHEYRGPPNAPKNSTTPTSVSSVSESSELWLQQQQLFLRLQQECMQNHTQVATTPPLLPITTTTQANNTLQKPAGDQIGQTTQATNQAQQLFESPNSPQKLLSNFEDLKVTDLRAELKKKGLPVSGSKPQLIQRLRSHVIPSSSTPPPLSNSSQSTSHVDTVLLDGLLEQQQHTTIPGDGSEMTAEQIRSLLDTMAADAGIEVNGGEVSDSSSTSLSNEDIVQLQQIWIEKLQRDLERSRKQLQQCQIPSPQVLSSTKSSSSLPKASTPEPTTAFKTDESVAENKAAQRQIIHQILQQKIQQQELQKAQQQRQQAVTNPSPSPSSNQNSTLTALLKSSPLNASPLDLDMTSVAKADMNSPVNKQATAFPDTKREILTGDDFPTITLQVENVSPMDSNPPEDDFPGVMPIFVCHAASDAKATILSPPNSLSNRSSSLPSFSALLTKAPPTRANTEPQFQLARPPPNYSEATRQMKVKQHHLTPDGNPRQSKKHKSSIKSQAVDDVLEILINNGELSPSAAQDPITPVSLSSDHQSSLPLFTSTSAHEPFFKPSLLPANHTSTSSAGSKGVDVQLAQSLLSPSSSSNDAKDIEIQLAQPFFAKTLTRKDDDLQLAQTLLSSSKKVEIQLPHAFFSKPSSLKLAPSISSTNGAKEIDIQLAQSLMDLTPPSSTGFADAGCGAPSNSLDFDFPLDMTDIDAMELEGLDGGHQTTGLDAALSEVKPLDFGMGNKSADLASHLMRLTEMGDIQDRINDRGIDNDIIEFLGDFEDTSGHSSTNFHNSSSFGMTHDSDPLFSNGLDFFAGDDLDFKPHHDLNFMPWGENTT